MDSGKKAEKHFENGNTATYSSRHLQLFKIAFADLSEEEQNVFRKAFLLGFTERELAERINASPEKFREYAFRGLTRLHRAITILQE